MDSNIKHLRNRSLIALQNSKELLTRSNRLLLEANQLNVDIVTKLKQYKEAIKR
jgi:hypothetical protein